jgi:ribosomal protein S6--L-glutamate ligase
MNICVIMDNPETPRHPVIGVALQQLSAAHAVRLLDVRALSAAEAIGREEVHDLADLYLLKSHAPQALDVAHHLEQRGALVVNSWVSTLCCQDRVLMTHRMHEANLPWPRTWSFATLDSLAARPELLETLSFPLVIKSRYSYRGDVVAKVHDMEQVQVLAAQWGQEPVVAQGFAPGDGWDTKLWVIDRQIFAARRRSPLHAHASNGDDPLAAGNLPAEWTRIALAVGRAFNLHLYGIDLLMTAWGPLIVDVNSFPGFRGVPHADRALVSLVERLGRERKVTA